MRDLARLELDGHRDLGVEAHGAVRLDAAAETAHGADPAVVELAADAADGEAGGLAERGADGTDACGPGRRSRCRRARAVARGWRSRRSRPGRTGAGSPPSGRRSASAGGDGPSRRTTPGRAGRRSGPSPGGTGAARGCRSAGCGRCRRGRRARSAPPTSAPAGRRRCARGAADRRATACPRGRCRGRRRASARSAATSSAAIALRACSRSIGIRPIAGNSRRVVHESMYSALPMKNARRGIDCSRATESKNEMWLAATITPPVRRHLVAALDADPGEPVVEGRGDGLDDAVEPLGLLRRRHPPGHGRDVTRRRGCRWLRHQSLSSIGIARWWRPSSTVFVSAAVPNLAADVVDGVVEGAAGVAVEGQGELDRHRRRRGC